jgi:LAO/AO transport system kinase
VLAVDPSIPLTGGAVLGDRIRMMAHHADDGVFVRSVASRGRTGGLAPAAAALVHAVDAAGYPLVLLETVGTGQDGIDIAALAHTVVVVQVPGLGDGVQAIKAGQLEIGDVFAVTKSDLPGAADVLRHLRQTVEASPHPDGWRPPVVGVSGTTGDGVPDLLAAIDAHAANLRAGDGWRRRQREAARAEVLSGLRDALERRLAGVAGNDGLALLVDRVAAREEPPASAIAALLDLLGPVPGGGHPVGDEGGCRAGADAVVHVDHDQPRRA